MTATMEDLALAVERQAQLPHGTVKGRSREKPAVRARWAFILGARVHLRRSGPEVARFINRDHTTTYHNETRAFEALTKDAEFRALYRAAIERSTPVVFISRRHAA